MIKLADFDVYATDEGLFIVGDSDVATKVAGPQTPARRMAPELVEAWSNVRDEVVDSKPSSDRKKPSTSEKTTTGSKSHGDYDPTEDHCDSCDSTNVQQVGGCPVCQDCGWSKC